MIKWLKNIIFRFWKNSHINIPERSMEDIVHSYFEDNPEMKDGVMKAYYAYHAVHSSLNDTNIFFTDQRNCRCYYCGRTREQVRWDDLPVGCQNKPIIENIESIIMEEERKYYNLLKRGKEFIPDYFKKNDLDGKNLSILHHTHGYDLETVLGVMDLKISKDIEYDYNIEMEKHKKLSENKKFKEN